MEISDLQVISEDDDIYYEEYGPPLRVHDVPLYVVYSFLKEHLGDPTHIDDADRDADWAWHIKIKDTLLHVYNTDRLYGYDSQYLRVDVYHKAEAGEGAEKIGEEFIQLIRKQIPRYMAKLKAAASSADGFIFRNPYAIYFSSAEKLLDRAAKIQDEAALPLEEPEERSEDYCRSAFFLFVASFEGLLNLIYELYLKPALRDERIYNRLSREQVDIKLRLAPMYCLCFSGDVIDHRSDAFQRFQYVVDLRNDFIHANLTKPMRTFIIEVDGHEFFYDNESEGKYGLPRNIIELNVGHLTFVRETIEAMVRLVVDTMKPRFKHEFRAAIYDEEICVKVVENEYIIQR